MLVALERRELDRVAGFDGCVEGADDADVGEAFLEVETTRPLFARVAEHNVGSARVLARAGFERIGSDSGYAAGVGREVVEHIYRLAR